MTTRTASCACGQLKAVCSGEPRSVSLCHCSQCQKRTGSAFGIAVFFARERVTMEGRFASHARKSDSGHGVTFHFCPHCGSSVFWEPARKRDEIAVAYGGFADADFPPPSQEVYIELRHPWVRNAI
ncbi:MAG TPA: GFA family protein [Rhizomicrobium sp.]|nr:GFA family protein [Rhizomicrobium sp.]